MTMSWNEVTIFLERSDREMERSASEQSDRIPGKVIYTDTKAGNVMQYYLMITRLELW